MPMSPTTPTISIHGSGAPVLDGSGASSCRRRESDPRADRIVTGQETLRRLVTIAAGESPPDRRRGSRGGDDSGTRTPRSIAGDRTPHRLGSRRGRAVDVHCPAERPPPCQGPVAKVTARNQAPAAGAAAARRTSGVSRCVGVVGSSAHRPAVAIQFQPHAHYSRGKRRESGDRAGPPRRCLCRRETDDAKATVRIAAVQTLRSGGWRRHRGCGGSRGAASGSPSTPAGREQRRGDRRQRGGTGLSSAAGRKRPERQAVRVPVLKAGSPTSGRRARRTADSRATVDGRELRRQLRHDARRLARARSASRSGVAVACGVDERADVHARHEQHEEDRRCVLASSRRLGLPAMTAVGQHPASGARGCRARRHARVGQGGESA